MSRSILPPSFLFTHSCIDSYECAWAANAKTMDWVAQTIEICFLTILKPRSLTPSRWQGCFILMLPSMICTWSTSLCMFISFSVFNHLCLISLLIRTLAILDEGQFWRTHFNLPSFKKLHCQIQTYFGVRASTYKCQSERKGTITAHKKSLQWLFFPISSVNVSPVLGGRLTTSLCLSLHSVYHSVSWTLVCMRIIWGSW